MRLSKKAAKRIIIVLSVLLVISIVALVGKIVYSNMVSTKSATVLIPENIITPEKYDQDLDKEFSDIDRNVNSETVEFHSENEATVISLHSQQPEDNQPFHSDNMLPGDSEIKNFCVRVSHNDDVVVKYHANIRKGYEKLAEVLRCRIKLLTSGEILYDGLMRDMPGMLAHEIKTNSRTESELYYEVAVYLDHSVGNEYQNKSLIADFRWWVDNTGSLTPPQTGDSKNLLFYVLVASVSLLVIVLLMIKRRKEEKGGVC